MVSTVGTVTELFRNRAFRGEKSASEREGPGHGVERDRAGRYIFATHTILADGYLASSGAYRCLDLAERMQAEGVRSR